MNYQDPLRQVLAEFHPKPEDTMMLFPAPSTSSEVAAVLTGFAVGIPMGFGMYRLLQPFERFGWPTRLFIQWWSWFVGLGLGFALLVANTRF